VSDEAARTLYESLGIGTINKAVLASNELTDLITKDEA
jgi:hypothetical protein